MDSGFFHAQKTPFTPLFTPVGIFYPIFGGINPGSGVYFFYEFFHPGSAVLLHLVRYMPVHIQRERCCGVAQILLYRLHAVPFLQGRYGECMPLRYNYDKPEKPRISRVFGYQARFFILFQPEKSSREVVIS